MPKEIDGAFYRLGWDWFYPPRLPNDAGPFSGDGYMGMFRIRNGRVSYRGRYVRTPRFLANLEAGRRHGILKVQDQRIRPQPKRLLLATLDDDSTVVYYIVHDGIVKPRQN